MMGAITDKEIEDELNLRNYFPKAEETPGDGEAKPDIMSKSYFWLILAALLVLD